MLFDLDGTLVDTAPDMVSALNKLLQLEEKQPLPYNHVRNHVSKGGSALVKLGFGEDIDESRRLQLLEKFLDIYSRNLCVDSKLFNGFDKLLDLLDQQKTAWGVVTNKPGWLTNPLMQQLGLQHRAACVISGDSLEKKKPDPEQLLLACRKLGCEPGQAVYIGDHERDIAAGNAAGMHTLIAAYGYISDDEDPQTWAADGMITTVDELRNWLVNHTAEIEL